MMRGLSSFFGIFYETLCKKLLFFQKK